MDRASQVFTLTIQIPEKRSTAVNHKAVIKRQPLTLIAPGFRHQTVIHAKGISVPYLLQRLWLDKSIKASFRRLTKLPTPVERFRQTASLKRNNSSFGVRPYIYRPGRIAKKSLLREPMGGGGGGRDRGTDRQTDRQQTTDNRQTDRKDLQVVSNVLISPIVVQGFTI